MRLARLFALAAFLSGCPICPDGELLILDGTKDLKPNQSAQFVFRYGDETFSSPARCDGHWYVNGIEGGSETLGFVTPCGKYTAPAQPPPEQPLMIVAAQYPPGTCYDCCPSAAIDICITNP